MPNRHHLLHFFWLLLALPVQGSMVFDYGSDWSYWLGTAEASYPDRTAWQQPGFNEAAWQQGPTPLGYANPPSNPEESSLRTLLPSSQEGNYLSVFLRKTFQIKNTSLIGQLTVNLHVDDGFAAWINGTPIARFNVPEVDLAFNTAALNANEENLITTLVTNNLSRLLRDGTNVIAVQVFNANRSSSDLFFDASVAIDIDDTPPTLISVLPPPNSVIQELQSIEIQFDDHVDGVDASDLLINNRPASKVTPNSPREYVFEFTQPADGKVLVEWATNHGITDLAVRPNAFPGGSWSYTLNSAMPTSPVVITEFMADNRNGPRDDLGSRSDWIEIHNRGTGAANLEGWFLTDDPSRLTRWRFPAKLLGANQYLIVWASGGDRTNLSTPLHTSFKLAKEGGYLALFDLNTNLISDFSPGYPPQEPDTSYGRDRLDSRILGYFQTPTPGAPNATSGPGFAPEPIVSLESGVYTNTSLTVTMTSTSGMIYYTLNGSEPGTNSTIYRTPLVISNGAVVKARVFQNGLLPSRVVARTYHLLDASMRNFSSNLPLLLINTAGRGIGADARLTNVALTVIDTFRGRSTLLSPPEFQGLCQIEKRGQTSAGFPKAPYRFEINDEMGNDLDVSILGLPADSDWVLRNPYSDKCLMNDFLASELHEKMGHYAPRRKFVEVFLSSSVGRLSYPQHYQGVYVLMEEIKVGKNRVNIAPLFPDVATEPEISGGYILKKDKPSPGDLTFDTLGGAGFSAQNLRFDDPKSRNITQAQQNWIRNYLNQFERSLYATTWTNATGSNHYSWYIDVDSFVDQHWIVEYTKQIDGYRLSNYLHKDRNGKLHMDPIWDWNLSFGNANYLDGSVTSGWYYALLGENDHIWLRRLISGSPSSTGRGGDPDFNQKITDRWSTLRTNVLAASNVLARVDAIAGQLSEAAARDFAKYPRLGSYVWPNPDFYVTPTTYAGIIAAMKKWIQGRYQWIDTQFLQVPRMSMAEGWVPANSLLTLSAPAGIIYYTLDGTDPRRSGGAVSSSALIASSAITLRDNARVFARAKSGSVWSGPAIATFQVRAIPLAITEIMYHPPAPPMGSPYQDEDFEYIEFKNLGATALDLDGIRLQGEVQFSFPQVRLGAGERILAVANRAAFESRYGSEFKIAGEFASHLNNQGGRLILLGSLDETILDISYDDLIHPMTDGLGFSLTMAQEAVSFPAAQHPIWRASSALYGSPGQSDPPPAPQPKVIISEINPHPRPPSLDTIELQNLSPFAANIGGWFVTDDFHTPKKFRIPDHTLIPAGGFHLFSEAEFHTLNTAGIPFALSSLGEEVYLFSADAQSDLTGYVHGYRYGSEDLDVSFGRHVTSTGEEHFVAQSMPTLGISNAEPRLPSILVSEIMYHPPDVLANSSFWNNTEDEFVELHNPGRSPALLFDPALAAPAWRISKGIEFTFPTNTLIAPEGFLLIVSFNPKLSPDLLGAFRAKHGVQSHVPVLGPYEGKLGNKDNTIQLERRGDQTNDGDLVAWILVDRIDYLDKWPWPLSPDGFGFSLQRKHTDAYGNDPANWEGAAPTPGRPGLNEMPPQISVQPLSQIVLVSESVTLTATIEDPVRLNFQWCLNGERIPGATNSYLVLPQVQLSQAGAYQLLAMSSEKSADTHPVWLAVYSDMDVDKMGDQWERMHGLNPFNPSDAVLDLDHDGLDNRSEFLAGTQPDDPESCLQLAALADSSNIYFNFNAISNRTYLIQYAEAIHSTHWITLGNMDSRPTNFPAQLVDPRPPKNRYYRLLLP